MYSHFKDNKSDKQQLKQSKSNLTLINSIYNSDKKSFSKLNKLPNLQLKKNNSFNRLFPLQKKASMKEFKGLNDYIIKGSLMKNNLKDLAANSVRVINKELNVTELKNNSDKRFPIHQIIDNISVMKSKDLMGINRSLLRKSFLYGSIKLSNYKDSQHNKTKFQAQDKTVLFQNQEISLINNSYRPIVRSPKNKDNEQINNLKYINFK